MKWHQCYSSAKVKLGYGCAGRGRGVVGLGWVMVVRVGKVW